MSDAPAIEVDGLLKTYRDGFLGQKRIEALRGVSFRVERGSIFGLLGPNGAGKTTLIKILLGIVKRSGGKATLLGRSAGDRQGRRRVGFLPENHRIPRHHTGNSALEYYGGLSGMSGREIRSRRPELLELVGLDTWGGTSVKKYSKGMLQRLGMAQAMMHDPELLILDEPTDGVDPVGRSEMRLVLQQLKSAGKTVFINSHLLQEVELVCDRVAILDKGELRREGLIEEITRRAEDEIELTLEGGEQSIRAALQRAIRDALQNVRLAGLSPLVTETEQYHVVLQVSLQRDVDNCIDALRGGGIGIVELRRRRNTLEQAFLGIVGGPSQQ